MPASALSPFLPHATSPAYRIIHNKRPRLMQGFTDRNAHIFHSPASYAVSPFRALDGHIFR
jgi:hypothetical protein